MAELKDSTYFCHFPDYFWQFEDNGEVIAIPGGNTILYKKHLVELLKTWEWSGLPPFGGILLAYIATGEGNQEMMDNVLSILHLYTDQYGCGDVIDKEHLRNGIRLVRGLPNRFKEGHARIVLIERLTRSSGRRLSRSKTERCLYKLNAGRIEKTDDVDAHDIIQWDLLWVHSIARRFKTVEELVHWLEPTFIFRREIEIELPLDDHNLTGSEDLIQSLCEEDSTAHIGWLVKRIWSGLNIPLHSSSAGEQPIGGISDLTNKGDFDKILLSEFANDDVLLMSRLANNEALYIRRETPPFNNKFRRIILIDNSIRTWGIPRAMGLAVALAIANHPKTDIPCEVVMLGETYESVELDSPKKVLDALLYMSMTINPSMVLLEFFNEYRRNSNVEYILISESNVLEMPEMKAITHTGEDVFRYLFSTDYKGSLEIFKRRSKGYASIQSLKIPLEEMQVRKKELIKAVPIVSNSSGIIPGNCPMLLVSTKSDVIVVDERSEIMRITKYGDVFRLFSRVYNLSLNKWELVCRQVPSATGYIFGTNQRGEEVLLLVHSTQSWVRLFNVRTCQLLYERVYKFGTQVPKRNYYKNGVFYLEELSRRTLELSVEGREEETDNWSLADFNSFHKAQEEKRYHMGSTNVFSNIREVFITSEGKIGFNKHTLCIAGENYMFLSGAGSEKIGAIHASRISDKKFLFRNGSSVEIDVAGFFVLRSADLSSAPIYITASVNGPIGVCNDEYFSGTGDFENRGVERYYLKIESGKLNSILSYHDFLWLGVSQEFLVDMVKELPIILLYSVNVKYLENLTNRLEKMGLKSSIQRCEVISSPRQKLSADDFQQKILSKFISEIVHAV